MKNKQDVYIVRKDDNVKRLNNLSYSFNKSKLEETYDKSDEELTLELIANEIHRLRSELVTKRQSNENPAYISNLKHEISLLEKAYFREYLS